MTPCDAAKKNELDALDRAIAQSRVDDPGGWTSMSREKIVALLGSEDVGVACHSFADGAWSLELLDMQVDPRAPRISGKLVAVAYVHGARLVEKNDPLVVAFGAVRSVASDFDHDGIPELVVTLSMTGPEGGDSTIAKVLTVAHDAIADYAKAPSDITDAPFDFDGDGRLDFPTSDGVIVSPSMSCDAKDYGSAGRFLAHGLADGSFSTSDDVAKKFARKWCPAMPARIASPDDALCARLWSNDKATRARVTSCVQWDCALEAQGKPQPKGATHDCDARRETFDANVPFMFP